MDAQLGIEVTKGNTYTNREDIDRLMGEAESVVAVAITDKNIASAIKEAAGIRELTAAELADQRKVELHSKLDELLDGIGTVIREIKGL